MSDCSGRSCETRTLAKRNSKIRTFLDFVVETFVNKKPCVSHLKIPPEMEVAPPHKLLTLITLISLLYGFMGFGAKKQSGRTSEWILDTPLTAITTRAPVVAWC